MSIFRLFTKAKKRTIRIFLDMDGTLALWQSDKTMDEIGKKGYFATLPPIKNTVDAINELIDICRDKDFPYDIEFYILSAALQDGHSATDKLLWLGEYLPRIPVKNCIFVPYGMDKAKYIKRKFKRKFRLGKLWILLDDFSKNLHAWKRSGGTGIKVMNGINGTKGSWTSSFVSTAMPPEIIKDNILSFVDTLVA